MIHKKLLEFQKLGITLKKDGTNPHFRSSYVTLNEVLEKVKKPLNDMGIVIIQSPNKEGLWTKLLDTETVKSAKNGEIEVKEVDWVESFTPFVGATDMQKLGGAITYARRYSLISMLGLEDEDDDGEVASGKPAAKGGVIEQDEEPFKGREFNI